MVGPVHAWHQAEQQEKQQHVAGTSTMYVCGVRLKGFGIWSGQLLNATRPILVVKLILIPPSVEHIAVMSTLIRQ